MTLNDIERQIGSFMDFFGDFGCDTSLYHSQCGTTLLSLCNPNRKFGICIL